MKTKQKKLYDVAAFWRRSPVLIVLLAVEIIWLALAVWAALQPPITYAYEGDQLEDISQGITLGYDENGYYGATYDIDWQEILSTPELSLRPGRYDVTVEYFLRPTMTKDGVRHRSGIWLKNEENESAVDDGILILDPDTNVDTVTMTVWKNTETAAVRFVDDGGVFTVGKISIIQNMTYTFFRVAMAVLVCLAVNFVVLILCPRSPVYVGTKTVTVVIVLGCATALACAPVLIDGVCLAHDGRFHLIRIEGIVQALRNGQFPVRVNPIAKNGYGYATSLFYGELFLYFPAVLRLLGVTVQGAYQAFIVAVHILTATIAYRSFRAIFGREIGLVGAVLYVLFPYRLHRLYEAAAVGEYLAMTFLPAVIYGLWLLYNRRADKRSRSMASVALALAFGALLQSHVITTEIAILATAVVCLAYWRTTFRKEVLLAWVKAIGLAILLNLWFLVPFVTVMTSGIYREISPKNIQQAGQEVMDLFNNSEQFAIGPSVLICGALALLILCAVRNLPEQWKKSGMVALALGGAGVFLSTKYFPWDALEKLPFGKFLVIIQFPWRYMTLGSLGLIAAVLFTVAGLRQTEHARFVRPLLVGTAAVAVCCALMYWSDLGRSMIPEIITHTTQLSHGNNENMNYAMDNLYLPKQATPTGEGFDTPNAFTTVTLGDFVKQENGVVSVEYTEFFGQEGYIEFPLLYYPGYTVIEGSGNVIQSTNGMVGVVVPPNSSGTLAVGFREPMRWQIADFISTATVLILVGYAVYSRYIKKAKTVK